LGDWAIGRFGDWAIWRFDLKIWSSDFNMSRKGQTNLAPEAIRGLQGHPGITSPVGTAEIKFDINFHGFIRIFAL